MLLRFNKQLIKHLDTAGNNTGDTGPNLYTVGEVIIWFPAEFQRNEQSLILMEIKFKSMPNTNPKCKKQKPHYIRVNKIDLQVSNCI